MHIGSLLGCCLPPQQLYFERRCTQFILGYSHSTPSFRKGSPGLESQNKCFFVCLFCFQVNRLKLFASKRDDEHRTIEPISTPGPGNVPLWTHTGNIPSCAGHLSTLRNSLNLKKLLPLPFEMMTVMWILRTANAVAGFPESVGPYGA